MVAVDASNEIHCVHLSLVHTMMENLHILMNNEWFLYFISSSSVNLRFLSFKRDEMDDATRNVRLSF